MKNKTFLAIILLTPILVVVISSIYFSMGMSPDGTRNNGIFFKSYFDFNQFKNKDGDQDLIKFEDGKWILSVYVTDIDKSEESIYLMRQLNVALNRDINKLKEVSENNVEIKILPNKSKTFNITYYVIHLKMVDY